MKQDIERISTGLTKLLDEVEAIIQSAADATNEGSEPAVEKGREKLHRICGHLRNARDEARDRARKIDAAVHSNPWPALAVTAAVGFLAGLLVRRR